MTGAHRLARPIVALMLATGLLAAAPQPTAVPFAGFLDQSGRRFDPARLAGRPVLLNFIFAGCGTTCPRQTAELAAVLKGLPPRLRRDLRIVSVTVDPQNDTPAALQGYATMFGAPAANWASLTGKGDAMLRLVRAYQGAGAVNGRFDAGMHSTDVVLLGARGRVVRRYRALPLDRARLGQDLEMLAQYPALLRG